MYDDKVFERLAALVEELEIPVEGDAIAEAHALLDRLAAKASVALGEFVATGMWEVEGATSAGAWLRERAGMTHAEANAAVRTASRLRALPHTSVAWVDGGLSGGQVAAVVANLDNRTIGLFAEHEASLLPVLAPLSVADTASAMRLWRARAEATLDLAEPAEPERSVYLSRTLDGRFVLDGSLDVEGGEVLAAALRLAEADDFEQLPAQRRGNALVDVARFFLDHRERRPAKRHRPHLNVVVDLDALHDRTGGRVVGGGHVDAASIQRMLCDGAVTRVVTDGRSTILDYGTTTRTVPAHLWHALVLRDEHCRHHGCDRPAHWCEAHHVIPVVEGGPTCLDNLVLKCTRHHHMGHQPGWHEKLKPDGTLVATDPRGRTRTTHPPGLRRGLLAA